MAKPVSTRDRLLHTARRSFHERGYNDVGVNDICRDAGVVKGSFYHFFPSKDALLEAVVQANFADLSEGLKELERQPLNGRAKLVAQLEAVLAEARGQKRGGAVLGCNLGTLANELAVHHGRARKETRRAFRGWLRVLERMAREGIADGSLAPDVDPPAAAAGLLAVIQGLSTLGRTFNDLPQLRRIARLAEERLLPQG